MPDDAASLPFDPSAVARDTPLAPLTTMRMGGPAACLYRVRTPDEVPGIVDWAGRKRLPLLVLGGGSNMIVADRGYAGMVLKMEIPGITCHAQHDLAVDVDVGAGVLWDDFVAHAVSQGWWGVENMSLIPGTTGATAIQNVGAFGQECRHVIHRVQAFDTQCRQWVSIPGSECGFGYRASIFNTTVAGRFIITSIRFRLKRQGMVNTTRRSVLAALRRRRSEAGQPASGAFTQAEIRAAVIDMRRYGGGLPTPDSVGNCGSFFQTRVLPHRALARILRITLGHRHFVLAGQMLACSWTLATPHGIKIPPGILIRGCGLDTLQCGALALFPTNCTVLINQGCETGSGDLLEIVRQVRTTIYRQTGVAIPVEPVLIGFSEHELATAFGLPGTPVGRPDPSIRPLPNQWKAP